MINEKNSSLRSKSLHSASKRFVVYVEDNYETYNDLVSHHGEESDYHFVFTNRTVMQQSNEDTTAIKDTSKFYQFLHSKQRDDYNIDDFAPSDDLNEDGLFRCCICKKSYKAKYPFKVHEDACVLSITSKKAHCIEYREAPCYCSRCRCGEHCNFNNITGDFRTLWMVSLHDQREIQSNIEQFHLDRKQEEDIQKVKEAILILLDKSSSGLSDLDIDQKDLRVEHYRAIAHTLEICVTRADGKYANPRKKDYIDSLMQTGTWDEIVNMLNDTLLGIS